MAEESEKNSPIDASKLLEKAKEPVRKGIPWHRHFQGKIEIISKCSISSFSDFAVYYTPGVAQPCLAIKEDISEVNELTNRWNTVAVMRDL